MMEEEVNLPLECLPCSYQGLVFTHFVDITDYSLVIYYFKQSRQR